jgi:hypothetical protein
MLVQLKIIGALLILLALVHIIFPRYFNWKVELSSLSAINRELMYVHAFFIAFTVFLMGILCLTSAHDLLTTNFGRRICLALAIFWMARLCVQFVGYSSKTWKGKQFETAMHILFSIFWTYLSVIFTVAYFAIS